MYYNSCHGSEWALWSFNSNIVYCFFLFHRNQKAGLQWARGLIIIIIICLCSWCRHRDSIVNDRVFYSARLVLPGQMLKKNDCPVSSRHIFHHCLQSWLLWVINEDLLSHKIYHTIDTPTLTLTRAAIAARWADRFSRFWWQRFSRFLACSLILPLPRGEYPSACHSLFIFARCCLAAAAPRLSYSSVRCNAAITLYTVHGNTDLNPKYFHRFAFLAFASGTYLKVISITEKEQCHSEL